jgi:hypothetical protein
MRFVLPILWQSYNQPVSKRRQAAAVLIWIIVCLAGDRPGAQAPSLDEVLKRTAAYVADFHKQLSGIVAEETYRQDVALTARITNGAYAAPPRMLKSQLLLVKPAGADRYVELRDVFEVDGTRVHDGPVRLEALLRDRSASADAQIGAIVAESARYNIGGITRTVNTPLLALQFLDAANQKRFRFKHVEKSKPVFGSAQDAAANDTPVFRVSTEMWTVEYQEKGPTTIIKRPDGRPQPAHGRFWINPNDGSVLISELIVDSGGVIATITVSYQTEPLMGFLVPIEMRESYIGRGERIGGHAKYGKFRQLR